MKIIKAEHADFCFGVKRAVDREVKCFFKLVGKGCECFFFFFYWSR